MLPHLVHIYQTPTRTTRRKIIGHRKLCVHPGMILGSSEYPRNPRILDRGGELCPSWDDPRIVRVSQESQDTQTGGGRAVSIHPGMILGSSEYPRNPRILRQGGGGGGVSCVHPGMIPGSSEYPRNPRILRQGGGGGGRAVSIHPGMILGSSEYLRNPRILRQGGMRSQDRPSIPGIPGYSDKGGRAVSIPGEYFPSQVHPGIILRMS